MEKLTREEIKASRTYFIHKSEKLTRISKGDKRVNGTKMCAICGAPLSTLLLSTGETQATKHHYHCIFSELFFVDICRDIRSCYAAMDKLNREG